MNGKAEKSLESPSEHYGVDTHNIRAGLLEVHEKKTLRCQHVKNKTISVLNRDMLKEPFTILHEFLPTHKNFRRKKTREPKGTQMGLQRNSSKSTTAKVLRNN